MKTMKNLLIVGLLLGQGLSATNESIGTAAAKKMIAAEAGVFAAPFKGCSGALSMLASDRISAIDKVTGVANQAVSSAVKGGFDTHEKIYNKIKNNRDVSNFIETVKTGVKDPEDQQAEVIGSVVETLAWSTAATAGCTVVVNTLSGGYVSPQVAGSACSALYTSFLIATYGEKK